MPELSGAGVGAGAGARHAPPSVPAGGLATGAGATGAGLAGAAAGAPAPACLQRWAVPWRTGAQVFMCAAALLCLHSGNCGARSAVRGVAVCALGDGVPAVRAAGHPNYGGTHRVPQIAEMSPAAQQGTGLCARASLGGLAQPRRRLRLRGDTRSPARSWPPQLRRHQPRGAPRGAVARGAARHGAGRCATRASSGACHSESGATQRGRRATRVMLRTPSRRAVTCVPTCVALPRRVCTADTCRAVRQARAWCRRTRLRCRAARPSRPARATTRATSARLARRPPASRPATATTSATTSPRPRAPALAVRAPAHAAAAAALTLHSSVSCGAGRSAPRRAPLGLRGAAAYARSALIRRAGQPGSAADVQPGGRCLTRARRGAGGGAAAFDNRGLATGKAHPDNRPAASTGAPGAYPTSGSGVSDPSADLTNPVGAALAAARPAS